MSELSPQEMTQKINDLEATLTLLARDLQDMSDVVRDQQIELDRLTSATKRLEERGLSQLPPALEERPPHY